MSICKYAESIGDYFDVEEMDIYRMTIQRKREREMKARGESILDHPEFMLNAIIQHFSMTSIRNLLREVKNISLPEK